MASNNSMLHATDSYRLPPWDEELNNFIYIIFKILQDPVGAKIAPVGGWISRNQRCTHLKLGTTGSHLQIACVAAPCLPQRKRPMFFCSYSKTGCIENHGTSLRKTGRLSFLFALLVNYPSGNLT